jgi:hypothetical protein
MQPDPTKNPLGALLQVLEGAEQPMAEEPILSLRRNSRRSAQAKSELADPEVPDQNANLLVERIAAALLKLRAQDGQ